MNLCCPQVPQLTLNEHQTSWTMQDGLSVSSTLETSGFYRLWCLFQLAEESPWLIARRELELSWQQQLGMK